MKYIVFRWKIADDLAEAYRDLLIKLLVNKISKDGSPSIEFTHGIYDVEGGINDL